MSKGRGILAAIVVLAIAARLAVMWPGRDRPLDDSDNYLPLAHTLAEGGGFSIKGRPTAYRPPLYPLLLVPGVTLLGAGADNWVRGLHLLLGAGTTALTALAARRWGLPPNRVAIAALIVALDPVLVVQSRAVMTETLAAFLFAAALASVADPVTWRGVALGGLALGLSALCRPSTLPAAGMVVLSALARPGTARMRVGRAVVLALLTLAVIAPWAVRNYRALGEPVWTTTHGGYTLALANNPEYYADVLDAPSDQVWSGARQRAWQVRISRETSGMSEPAADRALRRQALDMLRDRPRSFLRASLARLGRFWGPAPSGSVYPTWLRVATALWTIPLWVALVIGLVRRALWRWPCIAAPAVVLALTLVHTVFWTDLRMRAPIVPAVALIAARAGRGGARSGDA